MINQKILIRVLLGIGLLPLLAFFLAIAAFLINSFFNNRAGNAFAKIEMGATQQQVINLLGKPTVIRPCGDNLWWGDDSKYLGKNDGRCVTEVRYEYFLSAWSVGYSKNGQVVSKYHYFSE